MDHKVNHEYEAGYDNDDDDEMENEGKILTTTIDFHMNGRFLQQGIETVGQR